MHRISQLTDRVLVESFLLTREETLFRLLYRRHADALWRLALRLAGGNRPLAEDAVQDAWLRAVERLPQFRWESSLRTWLSGFVVNRFREHWRRERPLDDLDAVFEAQAPPDVNPGNLDLETAVAALPAGYRTVLLLHDVEGFRHEEIAAMLGISPGTSKSQLSRARAAVRRAIGSETN